MKNKIWLLIMICFLFLWQITFAQTPRESVPEKLTPKTITLPTVEPAKPTASEINAALNKPKTTTPTTPTQNTAMGIRMNETCLLNWQCGFNIYEFLGIRKSISDNSSPELFVQDILLSATFFIGTVVTIALIVSWLMFIFAGATGKDPTTAKAGIKNSFIWLLIVVCSYSIIRVVQYIAKGI